jgi:hypothetical protein
MPILFNRLPQALLPSLISHFPCFYLFMFPIPLCPHTIGLVISTSYLCNPLFPLGTVTFDPITLYSLNKPRPTQRALDWFQCHSLLPQAARSDDPGSVQASIMANQTEYRRVLLLIDDMSRFVGCSNAGSISETAKLGSVQHETSAIDSRLRRDDLTRRRLTVINENSVPDGNTSGFNMPKHHPGFVDGGPLEPPNTDVIRAKITALNAHT